MIATESVYFVARQAGHAAIGVMDKSIARIYAENLSLRFIDIDKEMFVAVFMDVFNSHMGA